MRHKVKRVHLVGGGGALRAGSRDPSRVYATGREWRQPLIPQTWVAPNETQS